MAKRLAFLCLCIASSCFPQEVGVSPPSNLSKKLKGHLDSDFNQGRVFLGFPVHTDIQDLSRDVRLKGHLEDHKVRLSRLRRIFGRVPEPELPVRYTPIILQFPESDPETNIPAEPIFHSDDLKRRWMKGDLEACLRSIIKADPKYSSAQYIDWLERHGDTSRFQIGRDYLNYKEGELRELKMASKAGSVSAAIILSEVYSERLIRGYEPSSHLEVPAFLAWSVLNHGKTSSYARRVVKNAKKKLLKLEGR